MRSDSYVPEVRDQYEDLPYPARNPEEERTRLLITGLDQLELMNHYCWGGRRRFDASFEVLIAGGGTGDSALYLAEQLAESGARLTYLDISHASMRIARERAAIRKLEDRITWRHGSLLDVASLGLGPFDYINCSGVLHHLADPDAGLRALTSVLKEDGALGLMVYGQYGRTGLYHMQALMRLITDGMDDKTQKIALTREVLAHLPEKNWFFHNRHLFMKEIQTQGDAGMYDLFLHTHDRAYTVPQIYDWLERCGLQLASFIDPDTSGRFLYDPLRALPPGALHDRVAALPLPERQAIGELLHGYIAKHQCFACRRPMPEPDSEDETFIPSYRAPFRGILDSPEFIEKIDTAQGSHIVITLRRGTLPVSLPRQPATLELLRRIDGHTATGELLRHAAAACDMPLEDMRRAFRELYATLHRYDMLLLRHPDMPLIPAHSQLAQQMNTR